MEKIKIKIGDIVLFFCLLLITAGGFYIGQSSFGDGGDQVIIRQAGKIVAKYPLNQDREFNLEAEWGKNRVVIEQGQVFMKSADCRDQYCVRHRPISTGNETIICLPHKLVVEVVKTDKQEEEVDSIAN